MNLKNIMNLLEKNGEKNKDEVKGARIKRTMVIRMMRIRRIKKKKINFLENPLKKKRKKRKKKKRRKRKSRKPLKLKEVKKKIPRLLSHQSQPENHLEALSKVY